MSIVKLKRAWIEHTKEESRVTDNGKTMLLHADKISDILEDQFHQFGYHNEAGRHVSIRVNTVVMDNGQQYFTVENMEEIERKWAEALRAPVYRKARNVSRNP
ncbi:MAG: hypothetical protein HND56_01310 [Pseudomonadota bacterium]|jgi:hypothetical protein|nr:hypothetical protein [Pseudomonadota bacterium]QKK04401.1 MAG: hypothetical protein HND56_01310 [Pseudomonadota bacterium]